MRDARPECVYVGSEKRFLRNNVHHGIKLANLYALFVFIVYLAFTLQLCDWG